MVQADLDAQYTTFIQKYHFKDIKTKNWLFWLLFAEMADFLRNISRPGDNVTHPTNANAHNV